MKRALTVILVLFACAAVADDKAAEAKLNKHERNKAAVKEAYRKELQLHGTNDNMLVLSGLVADKSARTVRIRAEATGLTSGNPIEFVLIGETSDHDYEAIAVSFAKPGDIHRALEFIGIKAGSPVNAEKMRFWPKGERVLARCEWKSIAGSNRVESADAFISGGDNNHATPAEGFVFVGSTMRPDPADTNRMLYSADHFGPNSIISLFNSPDTVIDVPYQANQSDVYSAMSPNKEVWLSKGQMIDIVIEPADKVGESRIVDLGLEILPPSGTADPGIASNLLFRITNDDKTLVDREGFGSVLAAFNRIVSDGKDVFLSVDFDPSLPLSSVRVLCQMLQTLDSPAGVRIEPPAPNELFYRAFVPDEQLRERGNRAVNPWELRIVQTNDALHATATLIHDVRDPETREWVQKIENFDASTPEALKKALGQVDKKGRRLGLAVLFVYAPSSLSYGDMMGLVSHALPTHPTVFVYIE